MVVVMQKPVLCLLIVSLSGCALLNWPAAAPPTAIAAAPVAPPVAPLARSAAALDTSTDAQRSAALQAGPAAGQDLGRVTVTLGNPTEQGFWLRSALVTTPAKGRVTTDQGASVSVDLLPGTAGAQLSLAAFRTLGLPLTGLPSVTVFTEK
jgi:hypothetical protein